MKIQNRFLKNFLKDWPVKAVCFLVAVFVYLFYNSSTTEKKSFAVPLTVVQNGITVVTNPVQNFVNVTVRTNQEDLAQILESHFNAYVSLNDVTVSGKTRLNVKVDVSEKIINVNPLEISVSPEYIDVDVDFVSVKYVSLEPSVTGEVSHGYFIESVNVEPSFVQVTGPEKLLNSLDKIFTSSVIVQDKTSSFSQNVSIVNQSSLLNIQNLSDIRVSVEIKPEILSRTYENIIPVPQNLLQNLLITSELPEVNFTLSGTVSRFESYTLPSDALRFDMSNVTEPGEYTLPLVLQFPWYLTLDNISLENIKVKVESKPSESETTQESENSMSETS